MKDYLPLGSVVKLKNGKKSVMIIGVNQDSQDKNNYDYVSVLHPEGYINPDFFFLFNNDDISEVSFMGCINSETQLFREMLLNAEKKENKESEKNAGK